MGESKCLQIFFALKSEDCIFCKCLLVAKGDKKNSKMLSRCLCDNYVAFRHSYAFVTKVAFVIALIPSCRGIILS